MKSSFLLLIAFLFISSCGKKEAEKNYHQGSLTILTDESFQSVTQALADGYMINYPDAKISVEAKKEDFGFMDLLKDKAQIIVMSRELNPNEISEYERAVDLKFRPDKFAADAVVFVVPKNSDIQMLSMEEIQKGLLSDEKQFIFDGTNSSNLNFVAQKLKKKPSELKFSIINGNENLIKELGKYPNKIGVIGLNSISRPYSKSADSLRSLIKILPITENGKSYIPDSQNLQSMTYPFTRELYFLTREANFGMASGFIRFSCTQLGQMIVQKEGLQRFNLYKREVQMR